METTKNMKAKILLCCVLVLICTLVAVKVLAEDHKKDETKPRTTQWQYLAFKHDVASGLLSDDLGKRITNLGQGGWELVSVGNFSESGTTTKTVFYFKRSL